MFFIWNRICSVFYFYFYSLNNIYNLPNTHIFCSECRILSLNFNTDFKLLPNFLSFYYNRGDICYRGNWYEFTHATLQENIFLEFLLWGKRKGFTGALRVFHNFIQHFWVSKYNFISEKYLLEVHRGRLRDKLTQECVMDHLKCQQGNFVKWILAPWSLICFVFSFILCLTNANAHKLLKLDFIVLGVDLFPGLKGKH